MSKPPPTAADYALAEDRRRREAEARTPSIPTHAPAKQVDSADDDDGEEKARHSTATMLVNEARNLFRVGRTPDETPFAVLRDGPNIALPLRGQRSGLRQRLAVAFNRDFGRVPSAAALADALLVLEGDAMQEAAEESHLRVARHGASIVVDLGTPDGAAVVIDANGWRVEARSPVLFRRSELTSALPTPEHHDGSALRTLRGLLNITDEDWPLALGWVVAALIPDLPHSILLTGGVQGTGKTTLARLLLNIVDPSPAPTRTPPTDIDGWSVAMRGSYSACIDNISVIPQWFSDALCCAATGAGLVKRSLYTDGDIAVLAFRRALILTSIDAGALKGDLADRLLLIDLEPIPPERRRAEAEIEGEFRSWHARILGSLYSLAAGVLKELPGVRLDSMPRMADFARVLSAVDRVAGTRALEAYLGQGQRLAETVIDGDQVARAVGDFTRGRGAWTGTSSDLMREMTPNPPLKGWPRTPQHLSGALKRAAPALAATGVLVSFDRDPTSARRRLIHLATKGDESTVRAVRSVQSETESPVAGRKEGFAPDDDATDRPNHRPAGNGVSAPQTAIPDDPDAPDDETDHPSCRADAEGAFCSDWPQGEENA